MRGNLTVAKPFRKEKNEDAERLFNYFLFRPGVQEMLDRVWADKTYPDDMKWALLTVTEADVELNVHVVSNVDELAVPAKERSEGHAVTLAFALPLTELLDTLRPEKNLVA
jgi:hypothetical protein